MKELSIEEKAKRYDEALKEAVIAHKDKDRHLKATLERIFPKLKESEEGMIRKLLIEAVIQVLQDQYCSNRGVSKENVVVWLEKQDEKKAAWTPMDEQRVENLLAIIEGHGYPGEVAWLNSLKDRVQPQLKQEWSNEDEKMIDSIIGNIKYLYSIGSCDNATVDKKVNWLKSLSLQNRWKPSDEQLDALYDVLNPCDGVDKKALESLYEQLKAL